MAKIKRLKDKDGVMHTLGDADVAAYESTLSGAATNVPYSSAVKAYADGVGTTAATNLATHANNQNNPHNVTKAQVGLGNVDNKSSATIRGEITKANVTSALGFTPIDSAKMGVASGVATLDTDGKVPAAQLPAYVDDVIEGYLYNGKFYQDSAHTIEITAMAGKIYTDLTTNKTYRWSGTQYTEISASLTLGETSSTAYRGDRGKTAYDHSQVSGDSTVHHTHSNKALLDTYEQTETDLADAVSKKHSHSNKAELDKIADGDKAKWDAKQGALKFDGTYNASTNKAATVSSVTSRIQALDATKESTDGTNVQVKVTETDGKITAVNITTDNTESKNNKVTSWSTTTSDTNYPSEKLVKTALDGKQPSGSYKTTQTAKTDPTASGTTITAIDTISQNANGEITATKKTIRSASATQSGVMSSTHYSKLEGVATGATKVESSTTNGNIKINGTEAAVYTHPAGTATAAAAKKVGMDALGHVVLGAALAKSDIGLGNVENKSSATIRSEITSTNVTTALGFTPMANTVGLTVGNDDDGYYFELS